MNDQYSLRPSKVKLHCVLFTALLVALGASAARADTVSLSVEVKATPAAVWATIGPFCAIKDWLPPVGECIDDGNNPPTRTLVTRDGKARFIELQTMRNDDAHSYSYSFTASPLPVTNYSSTLTVKLSQEGMSLVTWTGNYTPAPGKEKDALEALSGIYASGMATIQSKFGN